MSHGLWRLPLRMLATYLPPLQFNSHYSIHGVWHAWQPLEMTTFHTPTCSRSEVKWLAQGCTGKVSRLQSPGPDGTNASWFTCKALHRPEGTQQSALQLTQVNLCVVLPYPGDFVTSLWVQPYEVLGSWEWIDPTGEGSAYGEDLVTSVAFVWLATFFLLLVTVSPICFGDLLSPIGSNPCGTVHQNISLSLVRKWTLAGFKDLILPIFL